MEEDHVTETCPFCGYITFSDYQMLLHLETLHAEGESPFVVKDDISDVAALGHEQGINAEYVSCLVEGCGEDIMFSELENHVEMHEAETHSSTDTNSQPKSIASIVPHVAHSTQSVPDQISSSHLPTSVARQAAAKVAWKGILRMPTIASKPSNSVGRNQRRLGTAELGPYANEKQMPSWLVKILESDGAETPATVPESYGRLAAAATFSNRAYGIVPVLEQLFKQDQTTGYAVLCNPVTLHVSKLRREGGFCGYRNIQMIISYIIEAQYPGYECFQGNIPTVFKIQDYIENAWDLGINPQGRVETGGIRGTRKYIGTPDALIGAQAQAMFCSLGINCTAQSLRSKKGGVPTDELLFNAVEQYFTRDCDILDSKVRCTLLPPVYFQHPGHSLTIVGFEKRADGSRNIIVFDPMFRDSSNVTKLVGHKFTHKKPTELLKAYRRGSRYLRKYKEFEILKLEHHPPMHDIV